VQLVSQNEPLLEDVFYFLLFTLLISGLIVRETAPYRFQSLIYDSSGRLLVAPADQTRKDRLTLSLLIIVCRELPPLSLRRILR